MMAAGGTPDPREQMKELFSDTLWRLLMMTPAQAKPGEWLEGVERYGSYYRAFVAPGINPDQQELNRATLDLVSCHAMQTNQTLIETAQLANQLHQTVAEQQEQIRELQEAVRSLQAGTP